MFDALRASPLTAVATMASVDQRTVAKRSDESLERVKPWGKKMVTLLRPEKLLEDSEKLLDDRPLLSAANGTSVTTAKPKDTNL